MALDSFFIQALAEELDRKISGTRITKILMPDKKKVILQLHGAGYDGKLLYSAGAGNARLYLTDAEMESPESPFPFCMLLRKHLSGARVNKVSASRCERVITISITGQSALYERFEYRIVVEMMGRRTNFILLDSTDHILDCILRTGYGTDLQRSVNPGAIYVFPSSPGKTDLFETLPGEVEALCLRRDPSLGMEEWLMSSFRGFSPLLCRELSFRAEGSWTLLPGVLNRFRDACRSGSFEPLLYRRDSGKAVLSAYPLEHMLSAPERFSGFSRLMEQFYAEKDREEYRSERGRTLMRQVRSIRDRMARKIAAQTAELSAADDAEEVRKQAEFILANIHAVRKGESILRCIDYYDPEQKETEIRLDPLKTPQQNANAYYRSYNKKKSASRVLSELLEKERMELDYIDSVIDAVNHAEQARDLEEIRSELAAGGFLKPTGRKNTRKTAPGKPRCFITEDGFTIRVGRNNIQNEELTFRLSRRTDYWFHVKNYHGSHVVLSCSDEAPPPGAMRAAASLAVFYSEADSSGKNQVDYTQIRNVSRQKGALPGMVNYKEYRTMTVSGNDWQETAKENDGK